MGAGERVMLEEACRLADRLDRFDKLISANTREWARLQFKENAEEYELVIDSVVSEARQTAGQLRQHIVALGLVTKVAEVVDPPAVAGKGATVDPLDAARQARAARQSGAATL